MSDGSSVESPAFRISSGPENCSGIPSFYFAFFPFTLRSVDDRARFRRPALPTTVSSATVFSSSRASAAARCLAVSPLKTRHIIISGGIFSFKFFNVAFCEKLRVHARASTRFTSAIFCSRLSADCSSPRNIEAFVVLTYLFLIHVSKIRTATSESPPF